ncbi:AraC family transcriptional regulator [Streptomyces sp. NPDC001515]
MDVLSDVITAMRAGRPHSSRRLKHGPWGMRFPASEGAGFHVVLEGTAWLIPPGDAAPVRLGVGDVVFLAHGRGHALADAPDTPLEDVVPGPDGTWPTPADRPPTDADAPTTQLLCGAYQLNRARAHPLLTHLPDAVHLPARVGTHPALRSAIDLLGTELRTPQPGSDAIVPALLDTLLLYILRAWWLEESHAPSRPGETTVAVTPAAGPVTPVTGPSAGRPAGQASGWAAALADPAVSTALSALHADPAHPWTVEELGTLAGLSRAAFSRRFTTLLGQPPLTYLTWWRMTTAGHLLRTDDTPLRVIAQRTGYTSEFAFAKAFKREFGVAPGRYRRGVG